MEAARTDWIDGTRFVPGSEGPYEKDCSMGPWDSGKVWFSYWNGTFWGCTCRTPQEAYVKRYETSVFGDNRWRGLKEQPK